VPALKSFDEESGREEGLGRLEPRLLPIEVRRVVGSVSGTKVEGLTKDFLPRQGGANAPRYRAVYTAMQDDTPLPAIEVYALRGKYYVVDGHHRVAAARALGYLYLDALVHEFLLPVTTAANRLHNERVHFERLTGLEGIALTETGNYRKLGNQIREHRFFLGENGKESGLKAAAADWHEYIYAPITELLATSGAPAGFPVPERTVADLFVYLCDYKWVKSQNKGMDIGFPKALADFEHAAAADRPCPGGHARISPRGEWRASRRADRARCGRHGRLRWSMPPVQPAGGRPRRLGVRGLRMISGQSSVIARLFQILAPGD